MVWIASGSSIQRFVGGAMLLVSTVLISSAAAVYGVLEWTGVTPEMGAGRRTMIACGMAVLQYLLLSGYVEYGEVIVRMELWFNFAALCPLSCAIFAVLLRASGDWFEQVRVESFGDIACGALPMGVMTWVAIAVLWGFGL